MKQLAIRDVKVILTAPEGVNLVVVKVETTEPELYGLGCATFTQRHAAVAEVLERYLKPYLIGKDPQRIEDIWQMITNQAYWRNGPVLNNALSGVDMALWDIKGKLAGMPLYQLWGGKCREAAAVYRHADGRDFEELGQHVAAFVEQGYQHIRCQMGGYGGKHHNLHSPDNSPQGAYFDADAYMRSVPAMFEKLRNSFGDGLQLLHDVHERLSPINAVRLAKSVEPYHLYFLEDPLPPEQMEWLQMLRNQCAVPIALGELFVHPNEWMPVITQRLIDYIRVHISAIGGITPARKLALLCEAHGIRTAWHGPADVSPVGHAANVHLDVSLINCGIQEWYGPSERVREIFPGMPIVRNGYVYPNDQPGLGIDINEQLAAKYPCQYDAPSWTLARLPDGTATRP